MSERKDFEKIVTPPVPTTIWRRYHFDAAHQLECATLPVGHKCRNVHGHTYRLKVSIHGLPDASGMVNGIEYAALDLVVKPLVGFCDHKNLSDLFANSTVETLAAWFAIRINDLLKVSVTVTLGEGEKSGATVSVP
jgi:6-pyruvoyltetrahydropterin/6-carboxytetrahydropterin synthase